MITIEFDAIPPLELVAAQFIALSDDFRSYREPLRRAVREVFAPSFQENFAVGGRPSWEELDPETVYRKGSEEILIDSGRLERTVGFMSIWTFSKDEAFIAGLPSYVAYGVVHQQGNAHVPDRPFLVIQPEDLDATEVVFMDWIEERLASKGF